MSIHDLTPAARERASERAYTRLRDEILEWALPPGTILTEVEQSLRLGVSRTPVREALARLMAEGVIATHPGRGLLVTSVSTDDVSELFELRQALEEQSARLAASRRDAAIFARFSAEFRAAPDLLDGRSGSLREYYSLVARFDDAIAEATGNSYMQAALRTLRTHLARIRRLAQDDPGRLLDAAREHGAIADAIAEGDGELAAMATHLHLHNSRRYLLAAVDSSRVQASRPRG